MRDSGAFAALLFVLFSLAAGCAGNQDLLVQNPLPLPGADYEVLWEQTSDVIDNYFEITEENRLDGRIETLPKVGATLLEPWQPDAANLAERVEGTLQSVRRRAVVHFLPIGDGYALDVQVYKELEDLPQPQFATAGDATFRHDTSLKDRPEVIADQAASAGWIVLGRDFALEQQILEDLQGKLAHR